MNKGDFLLISDAVNEAIADFFNSNIIKNCNYQTHSTMVETCLRTSLASVLSKRLRYASPNFNESEFTRLVKVDHKDYVVKYSPPPTVINKVNG